MEPVRLRVKIGCLAIALAVLSWITLRRAFELRDRASAVALSGDRGARVAGAASGRGWAVLAWRRSRCGRCRNGSVGRDRRNGGRRRIGRAALSVRDDRRGRDRRVHDPFADTCRTGIPRAPLHDPRHIGCVGSASVRLHRPGGDDRRRRSVQRESSCTTRASSTDTLGPARPDALVVVGDDRRSGGCPRARVPDRRHATRCTSPPNTSACRIPSIRAVKDSSRWCCGVSD